MELRVVSRSTITGQRRLRVERSVVPRNVTRAERVRPAPSRRCRASQAHRETRVRPLRVPRPYPPRALVTDGRAAIANQRSVSTASGEAAVSSTKAGGLVRRSVGASVRLEAESVGLGESTLVGCVGASTDPCVGESEREKTIAVTGSKTAKAREMTPFRIPSKLTLKAFFRISSVFSF